MRPTVPRWHTGPVSDVTLELDVAWQQYVGADQRLLDGVLARHREKHRKYHNATHVAWVIRHVLELADTERVEHLDEVVAAAFYHDAIYEAQYPANERASARLARRDLGERAGWTDAAVDRVAAMIEATAAHGDDPDLHADTPDLGVLLDADLAILAADPAGYSTYVAGVRSEYRHLGDDDWQTGRATVLQALLDRSAIFVTATGHDRWEARARANIETELAALTDLTASSPERRCSSCVSRFRRPARQHPGAAFRHGNTTGDQLVTWPSSVRPASISEPSSGRRPCSISSATPRSSTA